MSLIDCSECRGWLSNKAKSCPHCGMPRVSARTKARNRKLWELFAGMTGVVCFVGLALTTYGLMSSWGVSSTLSRYAILIAIAKVSFYVYVAVAEKDPAGDYSPAQIIELQEWVLGLLVFAAAWAPIEPLLRRADFFMGTLAPFVALCVLSVGLLGIFRARAKRRSSRVETRPYIP